MSLDRVVQRSVAQVFRLSRGTTCSDKAIVGSRTRCLSQPPYERHRPSRASTSQGLRRIGGFESARPFTTTQCFLKKGGKATREEKQASPFKAKDTPSEDPHDFANLEADIASTIERLKNDLSKLRAGGRFNPEVVENLRVQPDKSSTQTVKLSDLAQVIPKGRTVQILVGEKDHLKPMTSSIQSSALSLTPQPDPTGANPLLLILNIPPPTAESRRAAVTEATKAGEKAGSGVRDARGKQQKKLRAMQVSKSARPDDLKKAGDKMEKVVEKGQAEVKRIVDGARKVLEAG
ncbi:hypothetical protein LTR37_004689 [Vermiconidia calcicola]|uniref:Uncharacterized protein n=1 Tax=Vermiconidia calcicola TaxID=1690605 RepID=A0ACC3NMX5_9PEZI|nr:hypothetical protein LTR37_004689 [Vermiconidia calcicola]